jgi:hypothetical protein
MANKKDIPYSPENNKISLYLDPDWEHYEIINEIKRKGGNVSKAFITSFEKRVEGFISEKDVDRKLDDHIKEHHK